MFWQYHPKLFLEIQIWSALCVKALDEPGENYLFFITFY